MQGSMHNRNNLLMLGSLDFLPDFGSSHEWNYIWAAAHDGLMSCRILARHEGKPTGHQWELKMCKWQMTRQHCGGFTTYTKCLLIEWALSSSSFCFGIQQSLQNAAADPHLVLNSFMLFETFSQRSSSRGWPVGAD